LGLNSGTACGPRTVVTGGGAENSCTFHINTAPKQSATTATNGFQTRAKTVLPRERGLTRSPLSLPPRLSCKNGQDSGSISTRLTYGRAEITSPGSEREHPVCGRYHLLGAVGSTAQSSIHRKSTKPAVPRIDIEHVFRLPPCSQLENDPRQRSVTHHRPCVAQDNFRRRPFNLALRRSRTARFVEVNMGITPRNVRSEGVTPCKWS
jgi:hypothetical protein